MSDKKLTGFGNKKLDGLASTRKLTLKACVKCETIPSFVETKVTPASVKVGHRKWPKF